MKRELDKTKTDNRAASGKRGWRYYVIRISVVIISSLLVLVTAEIFARIYGYFLPPEYRHISAREYRLRQPAPYKDAEYFSAEFIDDIGKACVWKFNPETGLCIPRKDRISKHINIIDGLRQTTDQPNNAEKSIFLFGGSTVICLEVPDRYTVASWLQKLINEKSSIPYKVVNVGADSVTTTQQLARLKILALQPDDIVVFFDGVNDVLQGVFKGRPKGTMVGDNRAMIDELNILQKTLLEFHLKWRDSSAFVKYFLTPFDLSLPEHLKNPHDRKEAAKETAEHFFSAITEAHKYSTSFQGRFVHLLQPQLYSDNKLTAYEKELMNSGVIKPGIKEAFDSGYAELQKKVFELAHNNIESYDLGNILNDRPEGEEYFLDYCHVTHKGNKRIAEAIFEKLFENFDSN